LQAGLGAWASGQRLFRINQSARPVGKALVPLGKANPVISFWSGRGRRFSSRPPSGLSWPQPAGRGLPASIYVFLLVDFAGFAAAELAPRALRTLAQRFFLGITILARASGDILRFLMWLGAAPSGAADRPPRIEAISAWSFSICFRDRDGALEVIYRDLGNGHLEPNIEDDLSCQYCLIRGIK